MPLRATDFESAVSAIPPLRHGITKNNMNRPLRLDVRLDVRCTLDLA